VKCNSFRLAVTTAIMLAGCLTAAGQTQPPAPKPNEKTPSPAAPSPAGPEKTPEGSAAAVDPNKYLIGPEDVIFIRVWREPDFTLPAAVRPDGKITMPLIGDVQAGDQTPTQLTKTLTELLGKYLNNPDVNVIVTDVRSKKYYIDGEVNKPGSYLLVTPTTVLEALSIAGGFRDFANSKKIRILRKGNILHFNYKEVSGGKKLEQNILVESGDHIIVP
jgi:polysaccharide export outer membrane protein